MFSFQICLFVDFPRRFSYKTRSNLKREDNRRSKMKKDVRRSNPTTTYTKEVQNDLLFSPCLLHITIILLLLICLLVSSQQRRTKQQPYLKILDFGFSFWIQIFPIFLETETTYLEILLYYYSLLGDRVLTLLQLLAQ